MAGQTRYTAVLDACVLYSIATTDALLSLATAGLFAAKWTTRIEQEWMRALEHSRPELVGKLEVRRDCMRAAVPDWEVPPAQWQCLNLPVCLPDPDDLHVLAAAIAGHADGIVTDNRRDFPAGILRDFELEAIDPDTFIIYQWDLHPVAVISAFKRMRARRKKPESTPEDFALALAIAGLPNTAERLREAAELI